ncbi:MAG: hypothetical protein A2V66_11135 [Ignavibacteria bacterium RBG_13_36_8]|nr:MAG: hypothetical protein A2V66_11135 [Ignavibacteria bacterium RBG_13_36_8]
MGLKHNKESKDLIVFFHGLGCTQESFKYIFNYPDFAKYSLLLIDFIGFGKSSKPEEFSYTMEEQARICELLLETFPKMKIHIVAHSMGGAVPLLFYNELYPRIISFANIEGNLIAADCEMLSRPIVNAGYEKYRDELFEKQRNDFAQFEGLKFDETTPHAMYLSAKSLVEWSDSNILLEKFKSLKCKKAYFYGEKNKSMEVLNEVNDIEKIMISNSGHSMMLENHVDFYTKLYKFIFS